MFELLEKWRENRNIKAGSYKYRSQVEMFAEELFELMGYKAIEIEEEILPRFMDKYFDGSREPYHNVKIDAMCDFTVLATNGTEQLGYDAKKCMYETIAEISSRIQDPIQARKWQENKPEGKWLKFREQDPETLYEANYDRCRRS